MVSGEPYLPIPLDPDPGCPNCGRDAWSDEHAWCSNCGWTIEDVAETIAAATKADN